MTPRQTCLGLGALDVYRRQYLNVIGRKGLARVSYFCAVAAAFILLWLPEVLHYYVPNGSLPSSLDMHTLGVPQHLNAALKAKLVESVQFQDEQQWLAAADKLLAGQLSLPGFDPLYINLAFDPADLDKGLPTTQLAYASLAAPDILLRAYEITGQPKYFQAAKKFMIGFCRYEQSRWLANGFLWNDHAIASRVSVLIRFWKNYLQFQTIDRQLEPLFFTALMRHAELLAKPDLFTVATNHGVMQNLALLQLTSAFPSLPEAAHFRSVAFTRLKLQVPFYVNPEGVVLEHSASYHAHGVALLATAIDLLQQNGLVPPEDWLIRAQKSRRFLANLNRPDGTLPVFGNTEWQPYSELKVTVPADARSVYPAAGYAIWWDGLTAWPESSDLVQTVLAWSNYPGHGHKLADEMSLMIWAHGISWLGNTGYWPYGVTGKTEASGWAGSNAPHRPQEAEKSRRQVTLKAMTANSQLDWLDLERRNDDGFNVRRQLIKLKNNIWIVLDSDANQQKQVATRTWTFNPDLALQIVSPGQQYRLMPLLGKTTAMSVFLVGGSALDVSERQGSMAPFAGWAVYEHKPKPASALVVQQTGGGPQWAMSTFSLDAISGPILTAAPAMVAWDGPEHYRINLTIEHEPFQIERQGMKLTLHANGSAQQLEALNPTRQDELRKSVDDAFAQAIHQYPRYKDVFAYRLRYSEWLLGFLLLLEGVFLTMILRGNTLETKLRLVLGVCWVIGAYWLSFAYLTT